jgi:hypothetical protein
MARFLRVISLNTKNESITSHDTISRSGAEKDGKIQEDSSSLNMLSYSAP